MPIRWTALLVGLVLAVPVAAQPALTVDVGGVSASGLTPNGRIVWFGVVRDFDDWIPRITHVRHEAAANAEGWAELAAPVSGLAAAVWVVVDVSTGHFAAVQPEAPASVLTLAGDAWQVGDGADHLVVRLSQLVLLLVRPGVGAWGGNVGDGGIADADQASDGVLTAAVDGLEPLGVTPALTPARGVAADLLVAIDPETLDVLTLVLP